MELQAFAKLNLTLDVLGNRTDGYHDLRMVMQSITLADTLRLMPGTQDGIRIRSNAGFLPDGEDNLAVKAAQAFWNARHETPKPLEIELEKRIPVCAGMAGGSSDAAAVLRGLNEQTGKPYSLMELAKIGESVGSDVPYCVLGNTALVEGRGEILTPLPALPRCWIVVCKPDFPISTPALFRKIDEVAIQKRPDTEKMLLALENSDLHEVAAQLCNVFEEALEGEQKAEVEAIKAQLLASGALGAVMSGSGPTVFGLFEDEAKAEAAYAALAKQYQETYLTQPR